MKSNRMTQKQISDKFQLLHIKNAAHSISRVCSVFELIKCIEIRLLTIAEVCE